MIAASLDHQLTLVEDPINYLAEMTEVRGPVMELPFAICDAQSISADDFVTSDFDLPASAG